MKRFISSLALVLAATGLAQAHYVIVRMNLGAPPPPPPAPKVGQPNLPTAVGGGLQPLVPYQPGRPTPVPAKRPVGMPPPPPGSTISLVVLIEYQKQYPVADQFTKQLRPDRIIIDHAWGRTQLAFDQKAIQVFPLMDEGLKGKRVPRPAIGQIYDIRHKDMVYDKSATAAKFVEMADWALTNGLEAKIPDLLKQVNERNQNNDPGITKLVETYDKVSKQMAQSPGRDESFVSGKSLEGLKVAKSEHFTLYYDAPAGSSPEVKSRLDKMEQQYRAFFYWFALRGKELPVPDRKLVCILVDRPNDFRLIHQAFGASPLVADGFYVPRENLAVFASMPLDQTYELASRHFRELTQTGWDLRALLNAKTQYPKGKTIDESAYAQTLALLQKALHEESEIASVSHAASRQLLTSTGLLPRTVILPEWIQYGFPSFFETPKFSTETLTGAFWTTYGAPHWVYHPMWRDLEQRQALDDPEDALRSVVTDFYFREARADPRALSQARMMAWSLTYYLAHRKLDSLLAYCKELGNLPRDLELDDDTYLACFARAFDMAGPGGKGVDEAKFKALAGDWYKFISIAPFPEVSQDTQKALLDMRKKGP